MVGVAERLPVAAAPASWPGARLTPTGRPALALVTVLSLLASAASVAHLHGLVIDDAWITYRYADNLAHGHGWVYNLGRPTTDAASAPLYTALLAALSLVVGSVQRASTVVYVLATAGTCVAGYWLLARRGLAVAGVVAAVLVVTSPWIASTRGMENALFTALTLATVVALAERRDALTGVAATLLTLTRADGAVLALIALVWVVARRRADAGRWSRAVLPRRLVVGALAVAVPWSVFAVTVVGELVPDTLGAKVAQGRSGYWTGILYLDGPRVLPGLLGVTTWFHLTLPAMALGLVVLARSRRGRLALLPLVLLGVVVFGVYAFVIRPPDYHWYYVTPLVSALFVGALGIGHLLHHGWAAKDHVRLAAGLVLAVAIPVAGWQHPFVDTRFDDYRATGVWLAGHTPADASVASTEIGVIGWYAHRDVVDYIGLLSAQSVQDLQDRNLTRWLVREDPDYWVLRTPTGFENPALDQDWVSLAYRPVWSTTITIVLQRERPLDEAQALSSTVVRPFAVALAPAATPAQTSALTRLVGVLASSPDLQARFVGADGTLDVAGLLQWATAAPGTWGPTLGASQAGLQAVQVTAARPAVAALLAQTAAPAP